jgi:DNA-binding Xre family transcriptional regulator
MHIGKQIVNIQRDRGIQCQDLAKKLGIVPQQLSRWRRSEDLKFSLVEKVANALGLSIHEFIEYERKITG